jgi:hypothetical protein
VNCCAGDSRSQHPPNSGQWNRSKVCSQGEASREDLQDVVRGKVQGTGKYPFLILGTSRWCGSTERSVRVSISWVKMYARDQNTTDKQIRKLKQTKEDRRTEELMKCSKRAVDTFRLVLSVSQHKIGGIWLGSCTLPAALAWGAFRTIFSVMLVALVVAGRKTSLCGNRGRQPSIG